MLMLNPVSQLMQSCRVGKGQEMSYHVPYTCNVSQSQQPFLCCETLLSSAEDRETVGVFGFVVSQQDGTRG
jgi:hypothetical protein